MKSVDALIGRDLVPDDLGESRRCRGGGGGGGEGWRGLSTGWTGEAGNGVDDASVCEPEPEPAVVSSESSPSCPALCTSLSRLGCIVLDGEERESVIAMRTG